MESLIKQTSTRDRNILLIGKSTILREKKRTLSWVGRSFARQMSGDYDYSTADYAAAIAAAAFAVQSLDDSRTKDHKGTTYDPDKPLNSLNSKAEVEEILPGPRKSSLKLSEESPKTSFRDKRVPEKAPPVKKKVSFEDITDKPENPALGRTAERAQSTARSPSFADKNLDMNMIDRKKPGTSLPIPDHPPIGSSMTKPVENRIKKAIKPGPGNAKADSWEKTEMVSIKERYEKMMANVENWGTERKAQAKRKIERIEAELDRRRLKAMQRYHDSITRIERIARGAKAQAEETRRNEEFKAKERANKIRSTGKLPATCLCF
ncbi:uncharacterized protein LOC142556276 [Primulina tabacum]|uniref:uncharacterized protein LOC142556276 n=1 Tax=Primulina tabacum TaxID=48773 RepID=UPI003F5ACE37